MTRISGCISVRKSHPGTRDGVALASGLQGRAAHRKYGQSTTQYVPAETAKLRLKIFVVMGKWTKGLVNFAVVTGNPASLINKRGNEKRN
jgi:hypothetical protein